MTLMWGRVKADGEHTGVIRTPALRLLRWGLIPAFLLLAAATILYSPWLGSVALILALGSFLPRLASISLGSRLVPVWCLLWFLLPLPSLWDRQLRTSLQLIVTQASSIALDALGFLHLAEGATIEFPGHRLLVEEACSGIQSLFTMLACAGILAVWRSRPLWHATTMLVCAALWAIVFNIFRVTAIAIAYVRFDIDLATGWQHDALAIVLFLFGLKCLQSTDHLIVFLISPIEDTNNRFVASWNALTETQAESASDNSMKNILHRSSRLGLGFVAILFLLLGTVQTASMVLASTARDKSFIG